MYRTWHEPPELQEAFARSIAIEHRTQGHESNAKGRRAEERSLAVLQERLPKWIRSVRLATSREDARGIDLVIETELIGPLYVQIKSSQYGARMYRTKKRRARTVIVVVPEHMPDSKLREKLLGAIHFTRREIKRQRH